MKKAQSSLTGMALNNHRNKLRQYELEGIEAKRRRAEELENNPDTPLTMAELAYRRAQEIEALEKKLGFSTGGGPAYHESWPRKEGSIVVGSTATHAFKPVADIREY